MAFTAAVIHVTYLNVPLFDARKTNTLGTAVPDTKRC